MSDENPVPPVVPPVLEPDPAPPPPPPPPPAPDPVIETAAQQAVDRAEAAATRRRWVTLAELVGVAGLLIAALSLWMSWSDRRADEQERHAEKASESKARTLVLLTATPDDGGKRLVLKDDAHPIQSIDVRFPAALGVSNQTSVLEPHIEADWFSAPILKATDGGPDAREGRLPMMITSSYWDADTQRTDSAIYDVIWETHGRRVRSRAFRLKGLILRERTSQPARLEALWAREKPKPAS